MIKLEEFLTRYPHEFRRLHPQAPGLSIRWKRGRGESYSMEWLNGGISILGESPLGAANALALARPALLSGHVAEYTGRHAPRLPVRPLWVAHCDKEKMRNDPEKRASFAEHLLLLGYNTAVIEEAPSAWKSLLPWMETLRQYGIKIAWKPLLEGWPQPEWKIAAWASVVNEILTPLKELPFTLDFVLWESKIYAYKSLKDPALRDFLEVDLARLETAAFEQFLPGETALLYLIPTPHADCADKQARWIPKLCQSLSKKTYLACSAHAGPPEETYLPPHPLWNGIRSTGRTSYSRLLPVLNGGFVRLGEGFWPAVPLQLIQRFLSGCRPEVCAGAVIVTSRLPKETAWLSCGLWLAAQTLSGAGAPYSLLDTWIGAYMRGPGRAIDLPSLMEKLERIVYSLGLLKVQLTKHSAASAREGGKYLADSLLAQLNELEAAVSACRSESAEMRLFQDQLAYFVCDARKMILAFLQHYQLPALNVLSGKDLLESFWVDLTNLGNQGMTAGVRARLREIPNCGKPASSMAIIYEDLMNLS